MSAPFDATAPRYTGLTKRAEELSTQFGVHIGALVLQAAVEGAREGIEWSAQFVDACGQHPTTMPALVPFYQELRDALRLAALQIEDPK